MHPTRDTNTLIKRNRAGGRVMPGVRLLRISMARAFTIDRPAVIIGLLLLGGCGFFAFQCGFFSFQHVLKGPTVVSTEWIEISPERPLKPEGEPPGVGVDLDEAYRVDHEPDEGFAVYLPDGSRVTPEVQLVDTGGNTIPLKLTGAAGEHLARYTLPPEVLDRRFRSVRIRSEKPVGCEKIVWLTSREL
jgi:hypothetical protein